MKDIVDKLEDCLNVIDIPKQNGGPGYDDRSKKFLRDMGERVIDGDSAWISDPQLKWLNDLYDKI